MFVKRGLILAASVSMSAFCSHATAATPQQQERQASLSSTPRLKVEPSKVPAQSGPRGNEAKPASGARKAAQAPAETVIVTGTHAYNRTARTSSAPITVISSAALRRSGQLNLADALTRVDPSITTQNLAGDAGALTSSIRMRGLNPNEVLVLVDGKRRHVTGNIYADGGPQQGSTPVDLNMIPASAIDHIEVLRDGAAALYGSDAIAGVINIITKRTDHGLNVVAQTGANAYNGDGWQYLVGVDGGFKLGNDGFVHLSGQAYHTDFFVSKSRGTDDHRWTTTSSWPADSNHSQMTPEETRGNLSIEWEKPINENVKTYGLITYAHRHAESYQNYRLPSIAPSYYPGGFSPREVIDEDDFQANIGVKGDNLFGFDWDLSTLYGQDGDAIRNRNSVNTGWLSAYGWSPTSFRAENYTMAQWTSNFDMRRNFNIAHLVPVTFAIGAEHRLETYQIKAGEPASYLYGGAAAYAGLTPQNAGNWQRNVWAGYIDGDFHPLKHWDLDFAGRFEHYTDFGNTETGKVTTRYDITRRIAVRATISNGFRAPSLAEEHFSSLNVSPTGATGLLSTTSAAGRLIGANPLKPERSTNIEGGIIVEPLDGLHISADLYQINIRDRITGAQAVNGQAAYDAIALTGVQVPTGPGVDISDISANYFANVGSTRTQGVDIQADYRWRLRQYGTLDLSLAVNLNRTRIHHVNTNAFGQPMASAQTIGYLTSAAPRSKIILNAYWAVGRWDVNIRQTRYGQTTSMLSYEDLAPAAIRYSTTQFAQFVNTPVWLTDLEVGYRIDPHWHVALGANNIFNQRPRRLNPINNYLGPRMYDQSASGISIVGGYYYGRLNVSF